MFTIPAPTVAPYVEHRPGHPSGMEWLAFPGWFGTATGKPFCQGVYATEAEALAAVGIEVPTDEPYAWQDEPVVFDSVAYDSEGEGGLQWSCPECGVGGTNRGGETDHNRYAHRATLEWDAEHHGGTWFVTPASEWGASENLAYEAALYNPGIRFAMACTCNRYDGWNDETQVHQYGCGESFGFAPLREYAPEGRDDSAELI